MNIVKNCRKQSPVLSNASRKGFSLSLPAVRLISTSIAVMISVSAVLLPVRAAQTEDSLYQPAASREETSRLSTLPGLPYVTSDMYDPEYWIDDADNGNSILASAEDIQQTNAAIYGTPAAKMNDLENYDVAHHLPSSQVLWLIAVNRCDLRTKPSSARPTDPGYDSLQESALRVGEPAVAIGTSADGNWYHVLVGSDSGWVKKTDVAICRSKEEWRNAFHFPEDQTLTITASKFTLNDNQPDNRENGLLLTMGTRLLILARNGRRTNSSQIRQFTTIRSGDASETAATNEPVSLYTVALPARDANGYYETTSGIIAASQGVVEGVPPLTTRNLLTVAFHMLGTPYGWGSMSGNEDCSGFVRGVYLVFGYDLPRNTSEQDDIPTYGVAFSGKSEHAREALLDTLPTGTVLFQNGHEMMYLGKRNGHYYVINDASSIQRPGGTDKWYIRKVIINTLDQTRHSNGVKWINSLTSARVPFEAAQ